LISEQRSVLLVLGFKCVCPAGSGEIEKTFTPIRYAGPVPVPFTGNYGTDWGKMTGGLVLNEVEAYDGTNMLPIKNLLF
jgi:hypothetical protein